MIQYRPFRNDDPPALAEIWRAQPPQRGQVQTITPSMLERLVLCKVYFDRLGLIIAVDEDRPIGFVHAGFGPSEDRSTLSTVAGVTCLLMVIPHPDQQAVARQLLEQSEAYLRGQGSRRIYGGPCEPLDPFYHGLYGGSQLPGVLASDTAMLQLYHSAGYREVRHRVVLQRPLAGFRPVINRDQMQIRRRYQIEADLDPSADNWWDACTTQCDRTQFSLRSRHSDSPVGIATFWDMEPLASSWGVHASGLLKLEIDPSLRRQGLATFLMGESLRQLQLQGVTLVEAQLGSENAAALGLFGKLGFEQVDQGVVFEKV